MKRKEKGTIVFRCDKDTSSDTCVNYYATASPVWLQVCAYIDSSVKNTLFIELVGGIEDQEIYLETIRVKNVGLSFIHESVGDYAERLVAGFVIEIEKMKKALMIKSVEIGTPVALKPKARTGSILRKSATRDFNNVAKAVESDNFA